MSSEKLYEHDLQQQKYFLNITKYKIEQDIKLSEYDLIYSSLIMAYQLLFHT